jgi:hypothetical protein
MKIFKRIEKWFDLNLGWIFVNGRKQDEWCEHLKRKYPSEYEKTQS